MTTALKFRNVSSSPEDPVETWPFEGILAAVERGTLPEWRRLASAIKADPWGPVASKFSRPSSYPALTARQTCRKVWSAAPGRGPLIQSEVKWHPRSGTSSKDPVCLGRTSPTG